MKRVQCASVQYAQLSLGGALNPFASESVAEAVLIELGCNKGWLLELYVRPDDARRLAGASVVRVPALKGTADGNVQVELVDLGNGTIAVYGDPKGAEFYNIAACGMQLATALREVLL